MRNQTVSKTLYYTYSILRKLFYVMPKYAHQLSNETNKIFCMSASIFSMCENYKERKVKIHCTYTFLWFNSSCGKHLSRSYTPHLV